MKDTLSEIRNHSIDSNIIETCIRKWVRTGINFTGYSMYKHEVNLEELIAATSVIGRYEPRLIYCMTSWIIKNGDLINVYRLKSEVINSDTAVLGALLEISLTHKADKKLGNIIKFCNKKEKPEMMFIIADTSPSLKLSIIENGDLICNKWNVLCKEITIKPDSLFNRSYIMKHNKNLARRMLFGVQMKTEIFNILLEKKNLYIKQLQDILGYKYPVIFNEIKKLHDEGIIDWYEDKQMKWISLNKRMENYLNKVPV